MKKDLGIIAAGLLAVSASSHAFFDGQVETASCVKVSGWAWDDQRPDVPIYVTIWDGNQRLRTMKAGGCRRDLPGNGCHGFSYTLPLSLRDGGYQHTLRVTYGTRTTTPPPLKSLRRSPRKLGYCSSLNDTGVTTCSDAGSGGLDCPVTGFEGQDGDYGRDALARDGILPPKQGSGLGGFDFTKIANDGSPLTPLAKPPGTQPKQWACTLDNHTGLMWEIKLGNGGLRDRANTYSWYQPDGATNGGDPGVQNGGICTGGVSCDTDAYVAAVNAAHLCGQTGWRLPTVEELRSIVDYGRYGPAFDWQVYFANTPAASSSWTAWPDAADARYARAISHNYGDDSRLLKSTGQFVRLVRNHR